MMKMTYLSESQEEPWHRALLHVERQQSVGHVDEEHGAPDSSIGRPGVTVKNNQHLMMKAFNSQFPNILADW